jgi:hypothetical protein
MSSDAAMVPSVKALAVTEILRDREHGALLLRLEDGQWAALNLAGSSWDQLVKALLPSDALTVNGVPLSQLVAVYAEVVKGAARALGARDAAPAAPAVPAVVLVPGRIEGTSSMAVTRDAEGKIVGSETRSVGELVVNPS